MDVYDVRILVEVRAESKERAQEIAVELMKSREIPLAHVKDWDITSIDKEKK